MARYTGPQWKKSRRLGFSTLETGIITDIKSFINLSFI